MEHLHTTICALATPPGEGGIATVRVSGPDAYGIVGKIFAPVRQGKSVADAKGYTAMLGHYLLHGAEMDECVALFFRAPHSYTGEDVIELSVHGGTAMADGLLEALITAGCAPAGPGEFTRRALENGRMSLTQAEAVMEVIAANGRQGAALAKSALAFTGGWYKLVLAVVVIALAGAGMVGFLGTRLGLSIRATGDNAAMVRASSINPAFTITVGLCVSGALCALSGGLLAQYQKSCDINVGTGMVTIALASLIIGETLLGKRTMLRRIIGVVFGSCLYRFIVAVALRFNVPAAAMKLVSAIIVAIAISMPAIKEKIAFEQRKHGACRRRVTTGKEGK